MIPLKSLFMNHIHVLASLVWMVEDHLIKSTKNQLNIDHHHLVVIFPLQKLERVNQIFHLKHQNHLLVTRVQQEIICILEPRAQCKRWKMLQLLKFPQRRELLPPPLLQRKIQVPFNKLKEGLVVLVGLEVLQEVKLVLFQV